MDAPTKSDADASALHRTHIVDCFLLNQLCAENYAMRTNFSFTGYHLDHLMSDYLTAMLLDFQRTIQTAIRMAVVHQHIHFEKK